MTTKEKAEAKRKQKRERRLKVFREVVEFVLTWLVVIIIFLILKSQVEARQELQKLKKDYKQLEWKLEFRDYQLKNSQKKVKELESKVTSLTVENQRLRKEVSRSEKRKVLRSREGKTVSFRKNATALSVSGWKTFIATGYCSCSACCGKSNGITASGKKAHWGTIAAPHSFPFGTKVVISAFPDMVFTVEDRGGAIVGNRIDIWFPTHSQALAWGKRVVKIKILK